jgi:4-amino-4-deoxy-L-arabinose transferase-like glycosyltransferase
VIIKIKVDKLSEIKKILSNDILVGILLLLTILISQADVLNLPYHWDVMAYVFDYSDAIFRNNLWPFPIVEEGDPGHPPFYFELWAIAWKLFGRDLLVSHLIGVTFAWLAVFYTYLFGKRILHDSTIGFLAASLLLFNPLSFAQFRTLNLAVPLTALLIMSTYYVLCKRHIAFILYASALALTKAYGFVFVTILLFLNFIVFDIRQAKSAKSLAAKYMLLSIPIQLYFLWFFLHLRLTGILLNSKKFSHTRGLHSSIGDVLNSLRGRFRAHLLEVNRLPALGIVLAWVPFRSGDSSPYRRIIILLTAGVLANLLWLSMIQAWIPRYAMPAYPYVFILGATGIRKLLKVKNIALLSLGWAIILLTFFSFGAGYNLHRTGYGSFEENLEYIDVIAINKEVCEYIETNFPTQKVRASWPLSHALRNPYLGYVTEPINVVFDDEYDLLIYASPPWYAESEKLKMLIQQRNMPLIKRFERNGKYVELYQNVRK